MKFPSIMRIAKHKRFQFSPRYYNPIKEDIENRTALIEQDIKEEDRQQMNADKRSEMFRSKLQHSMQRRGRQDRKAFLIQAMIAAILFAMVFLFLNL